jgi:hypothetical protein
VQRDHARECETESKVSEAKERLMANLSSRDRNGLTARQMRALYREHLMLIRAAVEDALKEAYERGLQEALIWCDYNGRDCDDHGCQGAWELAHGKRA